MYAAGDVVVDTQTLASYVFRKLLMLNKHNPIYEIPMRIIIT